MPIDQFLLNSNSVHDFKIFYYFTVYTVPEKNSLRGPPSSIAGSPKNTTFNLCCGFTLFLLSLVKSSHNVFLLMLIRNWISRLQVILQFLDQWDKCLSWFIISYSKLIVIKQVILIYCYGFTNRFHMPGSTNISMLSYFLNWKCLKASGAFHYFCWKE